MRKLNAHMLPRRNKYRRRNVKKLLTLLAVIPIAAAAAPAGRSSSSSSSSSAVNAAAAMAAMSAAAASAQRSLASASGANNGCQSCHQEIYPFQIPSSLIGGDCFDFETDRYIPDTVGKVEILTRKCGKIQRVYEYRQFGSSVPSRYFLPAEDRSSNPHYLLEVGK